MEFAAADHNARTSKTRKYLKIMGAVLLSFSIFSQIPKLAMFLAGGSLRAGPMS